MDVQNGKSYLKRFFSYYRPHMRLFITDMGCAFLIACIGVSYPLVSRFAMNRYLAQGAYGAFGLVLLCCALAFLLSALLQYVVTALGHYLGVRMEADMRRDVFSHLQSLDFTYFNSARTGALLSRCTSDLFEITELAHHGPEDLFVSILTFLGAAAVMFSIEWRLAMLMVLSVPVFLFVVLRRRKRMSRASRSVKEKMAQVNADIESSLSGMRLAQAFANETYEIEKFGRGNMRYVQARREYFKVMGSFFASMDFFTNILPVLILGGGGFLIMRGAFSLVDLMTFLLYVSAFTKPIQKLTQFSEIFATGSAGFKRFCEIMDVQAEIQDGADARDMGKATGGICFEGVGFAYHDRDNNPQVLEDINICIKPGENVAIAGSSGSGKSTLCHMLPRFFEPDTGRICIDGQDIKEFTLASLRKNIGIVQQDVFLFADTIYENIRYGRLDASFEEVVQAAKLAEIHEDIMQMPEGYETMVGERGMTLSGGQKQRVSIARIFLKNPPILILDEATSALDSVTEAKITAALARLSKGRTTITIAHRLSTIRHADKILVMEKGRIVERGSHDALLRQGGAYAALYSMQAAQNET